MKKKRFLMSKKCSLWISMLTIKTLLFMVMCLNASVSRASEQGSRISLNLEKVKLEKVFTAIEKQSDYKFYYSKTLVSDLQQVSVNVTNQTVKSVLDKVLVNSNLNYNIVDSDIVIVANQQQQQAEGVMVKGKVVDKTSVALPGVTVMVVGSTRGVLTDPDGNYEIKVSNKDKLKFSFIGMTPQTVDVGNKTTINITLLEKTEELEDVTIVAFGKQKKESVLASVATVSPGELKVPSSNLTTALAGNISGVISYQRSGEPGQDNAEFFVRGVTTFGYTKSPLILIDGVETSSNDLARLQPDDVASFSIMKDATATALYGARGANGVILVTTKEGKEGKAKISIRFENSISKPTRMIELADPITYMKLHNEAVITRDPLGILPYSQEKIDKTIAGVNPILYPAVDWYDELFSPSTVNQRLNFNVSGGGKVARYYLAGTVNQDNGNLDVDDQSNFNSNINLKTYQLRSNININVTSSTEVAIRFNGTFDDYIGPIDGGSAIYKKVVATNPVLFLPFYPKTAETEHIRHIQFGNADHGQYVNPYADMVKGYKEYDKTNISAQFELKQDLSFISDGLRARVLGSINRYSYTDVSRFYNPFFYEAEYNPVTESADLNILNPNGGTEHLDYKEGKKDVSSNMYVEATLIWNKQFNEKHDVGAQLITTIKERKISNAGNLQKSLPYRNMGVSGRTTYGYNGKYFGEFNFGYNGSERFNKDERFGFFPSAGLGWIVSKENFFRSLSKTVTKLKLKGTYGLVGNDAIGSADDRFFYLSQVNLKDGGRSATWGEDIDHKVNGVSVSRYANKFITWETAKKMNVGFELSLFDAIDFQFEYFAENRDNILMDRLQLASMGLESKVRANVGEAESSGIEGSIDVHKSFANDLWIRGRANFTYARGKFKSLEEPDYTHTPWLSKVGHSLSQQWGYVAERLFVDDEDVANSPAQTFGEYGPGDIKYKDVNGDGQITSLDRVPIGNPTRPEIIYGFGFSVGYKNVDLSCFFQGSAQSSFWIDANKTAPFIDYHPSSGDANKGKIVNQALLQAYADNYWSEDNRDIYALWPRLSDEPVSNNTQRSTWFMRDGSFLRLKSVELGYSLPKAWLNRFKFEKIRFYMSGTNLLVFSKFKLWDPEMSGNGLGYPVQKVVNFGVQVNF